MTTHTKGPWRVSADGDEVTTSPVGVLESSKSICMTASYYKSDAEVKANARLIAAAPDLLDALKDLLYYSDAVSSPLLYSNAVDASKAAIAKATGT